MQLDDTSRRRLRRRLLDWFGRHARDLPWRSTRDPYAIWVSEVMLQQTQVATVVPYFERFLQAFPTVQSLAAAPEEAVLRLWEGLGYYRRARQMHCAARVIVERHEGAFPHQIEQVQALPGIGRYTAGAILSIAFNARHPILEANTVRLYSRLIGFRGDTTKAAGRQTLWNFAESLLPAGRTGVWNQALMEVGGRVCAPRNPACQVCPLESFCVARQTGQVAVIPAPRPRPLVEEVSELCVVVWHQGRVLIRRRGSDERWSGLWDFPRFRRGPGKEHRAVRRQLVSNTKDLTGITIVPGERFMTIKHGVTRFRITLDCFEGRYQSGELRGSELQWTFPAGLERVPLSVPGRKIARTIQRSP